MSIDVIDLLMSKPDPWMTAAQIGRLPADSRAEPIAAAAPLPPDAWPVALADAEPDRHGSAWAAWLEHHGMSVELALHLRELLEEVLALHPHDAGAQGIGDWSPVLRAIRHVRYGDAPPDARLWMLAAEYERVTGAYARVVTDLSRPLSSSIDSCLPDTRRWAPLLLTEIGYTLAVAPDRAATGRLADAAGEWTPLSLWHYFSDVARSGATLTAFELAVRRRRDTHPMIASTSAAVLAALTQEFPDAIDAARRVPKLRRELRAYRRSLDRRRGRRS